MNTLNYSCSDIYDFLKSKGYGWGSNCWINENGSSGIKSDLEISKWFKNYFPSGTSYYLFRQLQKELTPIK